MKPNEGMRILLVEDDPDYVTLIRMHLDACRSKISFQLEAVETLRGAVEACGIRTPDVILLDLVLPDGRGLETLEAMRARAGAVPIVVLTNLSVEDLGLEAIERGAQDFIVKEKIEARELMRAIRFARERHRQQERLRAILRAVSDGVLVVDAERRIRFANAAAVKLLGFAPEKALGARFPYDLDSAGRDLTLQAGDGRVRNLRLNAAPIDWDLPRARLVTLHDVTELRRLAEARVEIREKRREEMRRDRFLSNLSHEMRSPLSVVDSVVKLVLREAAGGVNPEMKRFLTIARRNSERLVRIVKDLLDLSRLESGRAKARPSAFALALLIRDAVEDGRFMGEEDARVAVEGEFPEDLPSVYADRDMISQVLHNLIANAIRFAKSRVAVAARVADGEIEVSVADDGPGVAPEERRRVFGRFEQASRPLSAGYKGTGLGLPICREIVRLNGGKIGVCETADGGARFTFTLPVKNRRGEAGPENEVRDQSFHRRKND